MSNEVKFTISASSFLLSYFLQVFIGFTSGNVFVIRRNGYSGIFDSFTVPSSICTKPKYEFCPPFQANKFDDQDCSCYCPGGKNTFVFHDDGWTCLENGKLRELQECSKTVYFFLRFIYPQNRLRALNIGNQVATTISSRWQSGWQMCEVNLNSSWYLECNGLRQRSSHYLGVMKELFTFINVSFPKQNSQFALKVNSDVRGAEMFEGKIINLGIRCTNYSQLPFHGCLMFKLRGQQTCNVAVHGSQTPSTLEPPKVTAAGTAASTPTVKILPQSITTMLFDSTSSTAGSQQTKDFVIPSNTIGTGSSASTTQAITLAMSIVTVSTTTTFPTSVRPRPSSGRERSTEKDSSSLGLIAGITVFIVILGVFSIAFVVYRRRYANKEKPGASTASTKRKIIQDSVMMSPQTNSAFQRDDENEYKALSFKEGEPQIYASTYVVPQRPAAQDDPKSDHFYAALNVQDGQKIYGPGSAQEPVYNVLEETASVRETPLQSYGSIRPDQLVYHAGNHGAEPTYNVLEDPNLENAKSPNEHGAFSTQGPIYNILEEPYLDNHYKTSYNYERTDDPVYNVLEKET